MSTLRQKQISKFFNCKTWSQTYDLTSLLDAIKQMLNLNQPQTKFSSSEPVWKILIYDKVGQDIISPLISVKELRELGVTLFVWVQSAFFWWWVVFFF